jgi:hypothetical protein
MKNYFCILCHTLKGYIHCHGHYNHTIQQVFFQVVCNFSILLHMYLCRYLSWVPYSTSS